MTFPARSIATVAAALSLLMGTMHGAQAYTCPFRRRRPRRAAAIPSSKAAASTFPWAAARRRRRGISASTFPRLRPARSFP